MAVLDLCINNYLEIAKRNIDAEEPASEVGAICVKEQHMLFERANKKQCFLLYSLCVVKSVFLQVDTCINLRIHVQKKHISTS